jgi:hypothetical protein
MLSHKTHAENGEEAQTGAEVETEADTGLEAAASNRRTVDVVPSTHTDTADFCLRADQDRLRDQPPPELAPRDTFEVGYVARQSRCASAPPAVVSPHRFVCVWLLPSARGASSVAYTQTTLPPACGLASPYLNSAAHEQPVGWAYQPEYHPVDSCPHRRRGRITWEDLHPQPCPFYKVSELDVPGQGAPWQKVGACCGMGVPTRA